MRLCVALALVSMFASSAAVAAEGKKKNAKKDSKEEGAPGQSLDGNDPVYTEQSEEGRYAPKGVTGELKAKEEAKIRRPKKKKYVPPPRDEFVVFGDLVFGFGKAPRPGPAVDGETTDATLITVVAGASYDFFPRFTAGVRVPWSTASMDLRSGTGSEQEMSFGSPEITGEYRISLSRVTTLPIFFGIGIPLAQGQADPNTTDEIAARQANVNLLADAAQGWREGELFGIQRMPIVLGFGVRYLAPGFMFHAYDKIITGIDTGTRLLPAAYAGDGRLVINDASLRNVTLVGFTYDLIDEPAIWAGLDAWLAYTALEPLEFESSATDPTPLQFVAEPRAGARFGKLRPSLGLIFPIGGRLADSGISGVRLHVDYAF